MLVSARIIASLTRALWKITSSRNCILFVAILIRVAYFVWGNGNNRRGAFPVESDTLVHNLLVGRARSFRFCWRCSFFQFKTKVLTANWILCFASVAFKIGGRGKNGVGTDGFCRIIGSGIGCVELIQVNLGIEKMRSGFKIRGAVERVWSGADHFNSAPLHQFSGTPLHRSAPLQGNFWSQSGFSFKKFQNGA